MRGEKEFAVTASGEPRWIQRQPVTRAVTVTAAGKQGFQDLFGIEMERESGSHSKKRGQPDILAGLGRGAAAPGSLG
ncbi:hypothetical protein ABU162_07465 [Paenibacillus thiaminolyticus]|uniref:hypothetical protein n=1 Tax=Paenibacillus thiaminolyticus TaxID=49283 RepID=UPI0035A7366C